MFTAANWYLFQYSNVYIQIIGFQTQVANRAWIVIQKHEILYSTINEENKYKSKDHLFIYFQNNNNEK